MENDKDRATPPCKCYALEIVVLWAARDWLTQAAELGVGTEWVEDLSKLLEVTWAAHQPNGDWTWGAQCDRTKHRSEGARYIDPALLHHRSGAFYISRARQAILDLEEQLQYVVGVRKFTWAVTTRAEMLDYINAALPRYIDVATDCATKNPPSSLLPTRLTPEREAAIRNYVERHQADCRMLAEVFLEVDRLRAARNPLDTQESRWVPSV